MVPIVKAGLLDLVEAGHAVSERIKFMPTPGHSPAHTSVLIDADPPIVLTGDVFHHPCQIAYPSWCACGDPDPAQARASRRALLEMAARENAVIFAPHFPLPTAGRIQSKAAGFELICDYPPIHT